MMLFSSSFHPSSAFELRAVITLYLSGFSELYKMCTKEFIYDGLGISASDWIKFYKFSEYIDCYKDEFSVAYTSG